MLAIECGWLTMHEGGTFVKIHRGWRGPVRVGSALDVTRPLIRAALQATLRNLTRRGADYLASDPPVDVVAGRAVNGYPPERNECPRDGERRFEATTLTSKTGAKCLNRRLTRGSRYMATMLCCDPHRLMT